MAAPRTDTSLLTIAQELDENDVSMDEDTLYKKLLVQTNELQGLDPNGHQAPDYHIVKPKAGFCIKTTNDKNEKVFINVCKSDELPAPLDITEAELGKLLDADVPDYRVPLSIGQEHEELDKAGKGCSAYDVLINTNFYEKVQKSNVFKGFLMSVIFEGLENKYEIKLERNWIQLKNRRAVGSLHEHNIRTKSKPRILEVGSTERTDACVDPGQPREQPKKSLITEVQRQSAADRVTAPEPVYTIMREPAQGQAEFLVVEVKLPDVSSSRTLSLDVGEDRILLHAHPNVYHLDIYLPFDVNPEESGSQFNKNNRVLTLTLPVLS